MDKFQEYMKKHAPGIPPAPIDEWSKIVASTRRDRTVRQHRTWLYMSALTLSAAGVLTFINLPSAPDVESKLEIEDVVYREKSDIIDRGTYGDWLWLADSVDADGDD